MNLSRTEVAAVHKAMSVGNSDMALPISDDVGRILLANICRDLKLNYRGNLDLEAAPEIFSSFSSDIKFQEDVDFWTELESLARNDKDIVTYFVCLCSLVKARLKYRKILEAQPMPTAEQVGPRALLNYGELPAAELVSFLMWRKWIFDIDNRAAQETGYLFEPIIANAIGGTPASASKSPIRRHLDSKKGRQVDCIVGKKAYEIKMRVTIAASGQGRWKEELVFPVDCKMSGYEPVLVVFDSTPNVKLTELEKAFFACGGRVYIGEAAWQHLEEEAGETMAIFIEKYIRIPMREVLANLDTENIESLSLSMMDTNLVIKVGGRAIEIPRSPVSEYCTTEIPEDINED